MNRLTRLAGLALVLIFFLLAALLLAQHWLRGPMERMRGDTIAHKEAQFIHLLAVTRAGPPPWDAETRKTLETLLDAQVSVSPLSGDPQLIPAAKSGASKWEFTRDFAATTDDSAQRVRVQFTPSAVVHLVSLYQQTALMLLMAALGMLVVFIATVVISFRNRSLQSSAALADAVSSARAEMGSLTQLAKVTTRQSSELERERIERQRAEEDAHFQQTLLNRALEEKIRLGHDLHDGIIQSLYAAGLTVEAARNQLARDPAEAEHHLEAGLKTINNTIREVRSYIAGLAPDSLRQQTLTDSIRSITKTLSAGRDTRLDLNVDDTASAGLSEEQVMSLLQITREAVSNALRHGGADHITVRVHQRDGELGLLVQDNGRGFSPAAASGGGHGLGNMRSRAEKLGAKLQFFSSPETGTKLTLTMPTQPTPSSTV